MVNEEESTEPIVKMRGLPWSATVDDIIKFLEGANVKNGRAGVHITMSREGRPSGEAFVELESEADVEQAMKKDKQNMGHRYIEIFKTTRGDMEWYLEKSSDMENVMDECCIRLRGLPYGCTKEDVTKFFSGLSIVPNGISFVSDQTGRNTGEAYVQFTNKEMVESALKKHLEKIGHRYIEIFRSSLAEIRAQTGPKIRPLMSEMVPRPTPYDRGDRFGGPNRLGARGPPPSRAPPRDFVDDDGWGYDDNWGGNARKPLGGGLREPTIAPLASKGRLSPPPAARMRTMMYGNGKGPIGGGGNLSGGGAGGWDDEEQCFIVHMRGLPYRATEQDIMTFFRPVTPINVQIVYERSGRPSGEANVEFETYEDASRAMSKDKQNMNNRYIELFLRATPPVTTKPPSLTGRGPPSLTGRGPPSLTGRGGGLGRNISGGGYSDDNSNNDSGLFSRRGGAVSNSAYDGFYGTSMYRAASSGGGGFMR